MMILLRIMLNKILKELCIFSYEQENAYQPLKNNLKWFPINTNSDSFKRIHRYIKKLKTTIYKYTILNPVDINLYIIM